MKFCIAAFAAAALFGFGTSAHAATTGIVRGSVSIDGQPAGAGVAVHLRGSAATLSATTDAAGNFVFSQVPFGRYAVQAVDARSSPGQQAGLGPFDVQSDAVVTLSVELHRLATIGRTAVNASKGPGGQPIGVTAIGRDQIATLPQNESLNNLVETLPGIVKFSYNEPVAHGFHGLTYEIDGVPLPQGTVGGFSEILDPRSIDSLEVFTGSFPAEYGGARQGAVVNIVSHRQADLNEPSAGLLTGGLGTYGGAQYSIVDSLRAGASRIFVNLNSERTNRGLDAPTFVPVNDASNQSNQFLRTITNIGPRDTLAFNFSRNFAAFQIPINSTFNPNDPLVVPPGTNDVQREYANLVNVVYTINGKRGDSYTQIAPWYSYNRIVYDGDLPNDLQGTLNGVPFSSTGLKEDRGSVFEGLRLNRLQIFGAHAVKVGYDGFIENYRGNETIAYFGTDRNGNYVPPALYFTDDSAQKGTQIAYYAQDKWTPTPYVSLSGGLRYDHSTGYVSGSQLSPRFEFDGQIDPSDIVHFYVGRLYAAPFIEDTRRAAVLLGGGNPSEALPVYDLQNESDWYYEFGFAHNLTQNARATLNFWKRDVKNVLDTTQLANTPVQSVFNNAIGIAKGVEGRVDAQWRNGDSLFFSTMLASSQAGGISGGTFLFPPSTSPTDVTLNPEDHDQTFNATLGYTKRVGHQGAFFATVVPGYGTGYPVQFQNGPSRLPPHLTFDASFGREPGRGNKHALGFVASFNNFTNSVYLIKLNNGFNTTQWGRGFAADVRLSLPF